jgi:CRISPR type III-A-associated RAMP protein Csm4
MKEISGEEELKNFLEFFVNNNPIFTISDNIFESDNKLYFPKPLYSKTQTERELLTKAEKLRQMCVYKERKSKKYIDTETLNLYLNGNLKEYENRLDLSDTINTFEDYLRTNVQISRETLSAAGSKLYNYSPKYLNSKLSKKDIPLNICFLIKVLDDKNFKVFNCEKLLIEVFNIGFGKKKSSGFGEFELKTDKLEIFNEIKESESANSFLNFSNYLPSEKDNISDSFYDYHVKYGKLGEYLSQSEDPFKKPIIFIKPGSVFFTNEKSDFFGRCTIPGEISETFPAAIQNGYSFSLRANLKKD